jgi:ADP-ribosyl-[dinitrogen reductase] hydrolase
MPEYLARRIPVTLKGSCLCEAVRYEVDRLDTPIGNCHCSTCRKAHAAPYAPTARVARDHFHLIAGAEKLSAFESSPGRTRQFCSMCGSHIFAERAGERHVVLRVATLDDDPTVRPVVHIWTSHDVPWLAEGEALPRFPEWPTGR